MPRFLACPARKPRFSCQHQISGSSRAQRSAEGQAIARTLESLGQLGQALPEVMDNLDGDAVARALAEAFGMPARGLRSPEAVALLRASRQLSLGAMPAMPTLADSGVQP